MIIKRILNPNKVPVPSELTELQYYVYRVVLTVFFFIWLAIVIFLWIKWHSLSIWVAWSLAIFEAIAVPGPGDLMLWKENYEQYQKRFVSS